MTLYKKPRGLRVYLSVRSLFHPLSSAEQSRLRVLYSSASECTGIELYGVRTRPLLYPLRSLFSCFFLSFWLPPPSKARNLDHDNVVKCKSNHGRKSVPCSRCLGPLNFTLSPLPFRNPSFAHATARRLESPKQVFSPWELPVCLCRAAQCYLSRALPCGIRDVR